MKKILSRGSIWTCTLPDGTLYAFLVAVFGFLIIFYVLMVQSTQAHEKTLESTFLSQKTIFKEQLNQDNAPKLSDLDKIQLSACNGDENCAKDLKALCTLETNCNPERVGDGGNSFGLYQIYRPAHPDISVDQAKDIVWSTEWTLNRLRHYGYDDPSTKDYAIMRHNGTAYTPKTLAYLTKFKSIRAKL